MNHCESYMNTEDDIQIMIITIFANSIQMYKNVLYTMSHTHTFQVFEVGTHYESGNM